MIAVRLLGPVAVGVTAFRDPAPHLAVIAKVTVALPPPGTASDSVIVGTPQPLCDTEDLAHPGASSRGVAGEEVLWASDFAPRKAYLDVTLEGFARASAPSTHMRLAVRIGEHLQCDLFAVSSTPMNRIPLSAGYLRAAHDPSSRASIAPRRTRGEVSFLARAAERAEAAISPAWIDLPPSEDGTSFQAAAFAMCLPLDAVLGETIMLEGVGEGGSAIYTRIPAMRPYAFVLGSRNEGSRVALSCDTLHLVPDGSLATLVFRGALRLDLGAPPPTLLVGVEPMDRATDLETVAPWIPRATASVARLAGPVVALSEGSWETTTTASIEANGTGPGTVDARGALPFAEPEPEPELGDGDTSSYDGTGTVSGELSPPRGSVGTRPFGDRDPRGGPPVAVVGALAGLPFRTDIAATPPRVPPRSPEASLRDVDDGRTADEEEIGTGTVTIETPEMVAALRMAIAGASVPREAPPAPGRATRPGASGHVELPSDPLARFGVPPPAAVSTPQGRNDPTAPERFAPLGQASPSPAAPAPVVAPPLAGLRLGASPTIGTPPLAVQPPASPHAATAPVLPAPEEDVPLERAPLSLQEYAAVRIALDRSGDRPTAEVLRPHGLDVVSWALEAARWARKLDDEAARGEAKSMQELIRMIRENRPG